METIKFLGLFIFTAIMEILGCWLVLIGIRKDWHAGLLVGALAVLAVFAWLLTLHPAAAGRVYAAYGGVYVAVAIAWLWAVDGIRPDRWDIIGSALCVIGTLVIYFGPRSST